MTTLTSQYGLRWFSALAVSISLALMLTACTNSDFSLSEQDAYGTWRAGSDLPATLELADDGTFRATAWPLDVGCGGHAPRTAMELKGAETVDFSGTWAEGAGGSQNQITLKPAAESPCGTGWIDADFRSEDGVLYACTLLDEQIDLATAANWLILYRGEPEETPDSSRCFNYN
ncbi:hypothetical protein [Microbacterium sp. K27]|uniref:hypothetical protein n=1 Tax=Microbacterium sp. K27 TaxID=2305445 RepID=UPI00109BA722|nr:hypothetical protein [Microbacterium sp. K27]